MKLWKFDNFLKQQTADHIEKEISTDDFPWYYLSSSCADDADFSKNNIIDSPIFFHLLYSEGKKSHYFDLVEPIIKVINTTHLPIKRLHRVKANMTVPNIKTVTATNKDTHQPIHTDSLEKNYYSLIYYVNDSDEYTYFYEDDKIMYRKTPKKNKAVLFPSNTKHAANTPFHTPKRVLFNIIYEV
jgi:hypothetical protein